MHAVGVMEKDERNGKSPDTVAKEVLRIIKKKNPPVRVTVGGAYKLAVFLLRFFSDRLKLTLVMMMYCKRLSPKSKGCTEKSRANDSRFTKDKTNFGIGR